MPTFAAHGPRQSPARNWVEAAAASAAVFNDVPGGLTWRPHPPRLTGDARDAVLHRGSHLQIIASAGSGKTEVVAQRVADLMATGVDPAGIIAFTFTERAADELKARISARVAERLGPEALDRLGAAFVGTIHAYCFRFLQQHVARYETYDVLDEKRLTAFLTREAPRLHLKDLTGKLFTSIGAFLANLEVVENELIPVTELDEPFRGMVVQLLRPPGSVPAADLRAADRPGSRGTREPCRCRCGTRHLAAPDRRRVPGCQPGPGTPDRVAHRTGGRTSGGRRRRPGHLPVAWL